MPRAEFVNVEALAYRRTIQFEGRGIVGLATLCYDETRPWDVPGHGQLYVSEPVLLGSLQPIETQFLVRVATALTPLVFAPTELVPIGSLYVVHRGLALLRKRWLGVGACWGLQMILSEDHVTQCARTKRPCTAPRALPSPPPTLRLPRSAAHVAAGTRHTRSRT